MKGGTPPLLSISESSGSDVTVSPLSTLIKAYCSFYFCLHIHELEMEPLTDPDRTAGK